MAVTVHWREEQIRDLLTGRGGPVAADLARRARNVQNEARRLAPVNTGRLRASITTELVTSSSGGLVARVGTNVAYARWVHDGTGIYGPRGTPITPTRARVLSWVPRGGGRAYARSVRGVRPRPFLREALPAASR